MGENPDWISPGYGMGEKPMFCTETYSRVFLSQENQIAPTVPAVNRCSAGDKHLKHSTIDHPRDRPGAVRDRTGGAQGSNNGWVLLQ